VIELAIPGWKSLHLDYLVLDVNGTLTKDGVLLPGVAERLADLRSVLDLRLLSADTFGRLDAIAADLGVQAEHLRGGAPEAAQKAFFVQQLGASGVAAVGNGANDAAMLRASALGIAVLGPEGLASSALVEADVLVGSITDGLDLLLHPKRLLATLRR
jgi:soluble P-type ATPase